jgi:hypothetical protein
MVVFSKQYQGKPAQGRVAPQQRKKTESRPTSAFLNIALAQVFQPAADIQGI